MVGTKITNGITEPINLKVIGNVSLQTTGKSIEKKIYTNWSLDLFVNWPASSTNLARASHNILEDLWEGLRITEYHLPIEDIISGHHESMLLGRRYDLPILTNGDISKGPPQK